MKATAHPGMRLRIPNTTYTMSVGDTFNGILDHKFDEDWISIELEKGKTYRINLSGRGKDGDEAEDTILKLYDSQGNLVAMNDDIDTAKRIYDSELVVTVTFTDTYYLSAGSYTSNPNLDNSGAYALTVVEAVGDAAIGIRGTEAGNNLTGTNSPEKIYGLGGNDRLYGRGGDDELDGGSGDDTLNGGAGADKLVGGDGTDTASWAGSSAGVNARLHAPDPRGGHAQGDTFGGTTTFTYRDKGARVTVTLPDIENLTGSDYNDVLAGDQRANRLSGGGGNDILYGGPGGDTTNKDTMYGDAGNDKVYGGRGDDSLYGGSGSDRLYGGPDDDNLYGGSGSDRLAGGDDDDVLDGGTGDDILEGGPGSDIFRFSHGDGDDDITDFNTSRRYGDRIDLSDFREIDSIRDLSIKQRGSHTRIDLDEYDGGEIWLLDFDKEDLDDDDFIFYGDKRTSGRDDDDDDDDDRDGRDPTPPPLTGPAGDDILYGGSGANTLYGGKGDDVLYGGSGDDELRGGPGEDSYEGGPGSDTLIVDFEDFFYKENNQTEARTEKDAIDGGENPGGRENSDTLSFADWEDKANTQGVTVELASGKVTHGGITSTGVFTNIEHLIGSKFQDILTGDAGPNVIEGGDDQDTLIGGTKTGDANDTVSYESSDGGVTVTVDSDGKTTGSGGDAASDSIKYFENIIGSRYADTLTGDAGANVIEGGAGADTLDGKGGMDTLSYQGSSSGVRVDLRAEGTLIRESSGGHASGDKVKAGTFENITGSRYRDILTGDAGGNVLKGGAGNDELYGGAEGSGKTDTLIGGPGADKLDGGGGSGEDIASYADATAAVTVDLTESGRGRGDAAGDTFIAIDKFLGSAHDDTFIASENADTIDGGAGVDTVSYEKSREKPGTGKGVQVNLSITALQPATGDYDTENNFAKGDILTNIENVTGSRYADKLTGGDSTDNDANVIEGGPGDDDLTGGGGDDIFKFASGDGNDIITDFKANSNKDKIDLSAFTTIASLEDLKITGRNSNADTEISSLPGGGTITLKGYNHNTAPLTDGDFIFYSRPLTGNDGNNSLTGNSKYNVLIGGKGNDRLDGRGGNDKLYGGDGDDTLYGGNGSDELNGGKGSDLFLIKYYQGGTFTITINGEGKDENGVTQVAETGDVDTLSYEEWVKSNGNTGLTVTLGSGNIAGIENVIGSRYRDTITGKAGANVIEGGDDQDTLIGGTKTGDANDTVSYESSDGGVTVTVDSDGTTTGSGGDAASDSIKYFENIIGSRYADTLTGDAGANVIEGGAGADTLDGKGGMDTLSYQGSSSGVRVDLRAEGTLIRESSGGHASGDKVKAGTFENITGSRYRDILTGDAGGNVLKGGAGNDELYGGAEGSGKTDTLIGGPGADKLDGGGGSGEDIASYADATAAVTVDLTESGRGRGDAAGDTFIAIDKFLGSAHDDTFIASENADTIDGGAGVDTVSYEKSREKPGTGKGVQVNLSITALQPATGDYDTENNFAKGDILTNIENVTGSRYADKLTGGDSTDNDANVIEGGPGDDDLTGGGGDDIFKFASGDGNDIITDFKANSNKDKIDLSAFTTIASLEDLEIRVRSGDTEISSLPGGGIITLKGYNHNTNALTDDDFIFYTSVINGTSGNNTLKGDRRGNEINAGAGNDQVFGNGSRDTLKGEAGNDTMYGGADKDTLNGGAGDDVLDGGPGADKFVFEKGNGDDYIMDFNAAEDKIDLSAFNIASADLPGLISIHEGNVRINLTTKGGGTIKLTGVTDIDDLDGAGGNNNNTLNGKYKYTGDLNNDGDFNDTVNSVVESDGVFIL